MPSTEPPGGRPCTIVIGRFGQPDCADGRHRTEGRKSREHRAARECNHGPVSCPVTDRDFLSGRAVRGQTRFPERRGLLREKTATLARMLNMQGTIGMFGHVSIRVPGTDRCFISPGASTDKATVRLEQIFVYNIDGTIIEHPGGLIPLAWRIHTQIHRDRPDAMCIAHLHAPHARALGIAGKERGSGLPARLVPAQRRADLGQPAPRGQRRAGRRPLARARRAATRCRCAATAA